MFSYGITSNGELSKDYIGIQNINKTNSDKFVQLSVNPGFAWLKLLKLSMIRINTLLQPMNGAPYYYYSPYDFTTYIPTGESSDATENIEIKKPAQQVKFVMGYLNDEGKPLISKNWQKDSDDKIIDADCYSSASGGIVYGSTITETLYGITSGHLELRRSVGFAWPLVSGTVSQYSITTTDAIDGVSAAIKNNVVAAFDTFGFIDIEETDASNSNNLIPSSLPNNLSGIVFRKKLEKSRPHVWNIPYVWDTNKVGTPPIEFKLNGKVDGLTSADIWYEIPYPSVFHSVYPSDNFKDVDGFDLTYKTSLGKILDLNKIYKKFRENPNGNLTMTVNVPIKLGNNSSNVVCYGLTPGVIANFENKLDYTSKGLSGVSLDSDVVITGYIGGASYPMGGDSDPVLSGISEDFLRVLSGSDFYCFIQNGDSNMLGSGKVPFGNLRRAAGSLAYEYPAAPNRIIKYLKDEYIHYIQFTYTYTFESLADFVLFSMGYRHSLNHYFAKLNLLFKNLSLKSNSSTPMKYVNPATSNAVFLNNKDYVNNTNYSLLLSYEELINYDIVWKGFPYNFTANENNSFWKTEQATDIVDGYGGNEWISQRPSKIIDPQLSPSASIGIITNSWGSTTNENGVGLETNELYQHEYDEGCKGFISFFRPLWIEYSKMYNTLYPTNLYEDEWKKIPTYFNTGSGKGLNCGLISISILSYTAWKDNASLTMDIGNTYMVNWNMWTPDYGFTEDGKYNIDKILTADVPFNGLIH
jgi:hypothetical protein